MILFYFIFFYVLVLIINTKSYAGSDIPETRVLFARESLEILNEDT